MDAIKGRIDEYHAVVLGDIPASERNILLNIALKRYPLLQHSEDIGYYDHECGKYSPV